MQVNNLPLYEILSENEMANIKGGFPSRRSFWGDLANGVANTFGTLFESESDGIPDTKCRGLKNCPTIIYRRW